MCTEGWGGIEQMELVWVKEIREKGKSRICPYNPGKIGSTINTQWVVMGACTAVKGTVSTCGFCPLLWCIVARV